MASVTMVSDDKIAQEEAKDGKFFKASKKKSQEADLTEAVL